MKILPDTYIAMPDIYEQYKAKTKYLVEGEVFIAYEKLVCYLKMYTDKQWTQIYPGWCVTVGKLDNRPVNISIYWVEINGTVIGFYGSDSEVTDWKMIKEWLDVNFKGVPRTNHTNIHHATGLIDEQAKKCNSKQNLWIGQRAAKR